MNFFVVGIGRSGTTWLSSVLNQSPTHHCAHEEADDRSPSVALPWSPFPAERFLEAGPNYGECHGMLRYHLSSGVSNGKEKLIPRRAWLVRDTKDVIASWMQRDGRTRDELSAVCYEVLWQEHNLRQWAASDPDVRVIKMETLASSVDSLQRFIDWLEIDLRIGSDDLGAQNATPDRRRWFEWDQESDETFNRVRARIR